MKKIIIISILVFLSACSLKSLTVSTVGKVAQNGVGVMMSDPDVELSRQAAFPLIRQMEVFLQSKPDDKALLTLLSQSYGQYAFGFLEEDVLKKVDGSVERTKTFYLKGKDYGLRSLGYKETPALNVFEKKIKHLGKRELPEMYWTALSWAGFINYNRDDPLVFAELPYVQILVERVLEIDPKYENGSALALMGSLLSSKPKMLGGNPDKGKEFFENSIKTEPRFLMNRIIFVQHYAMVVEDKNLFKEQLNLVLNSTDAFKEQALANELAKRRAKLLLSIYK